MIIDRALLTGVIELEPRAPKGIFRDQTKDVESTKKFFSIFWVGLCKNDEMPAHQAFHSDTHPFPHNVEISAMEF